jgi:hypothetical protein
MIMPERFTTEGATDEDWGDYGCIVPQKKFQRSLTKYAKELKDRIRTNQHEVWEFDIRKGKKTICSTNIAPAGGDGHIILWRNKEWGIYINFTLERDGDDLVVRSEVMYRAVHISDKWTGKANKYFKRATEMNDVVTNIHTEVLCYDLSVGACATTVVSVARAAGKTSAGKSIVPTPARKIKVGDIVKYVSGDFGDTESNPKWGGRGGRVKGKVARLLDEGTEHQWCRVEFENGVASDYREEDLELVLPAVPVDNSDVPGPRQDPKLCIVETEDYVIFK